MKSISSSKPANSLFRNDPLFRNDQATRRTERAILRPIGRKAIGISDEDRVFIFKYYRDMAAGPTASGERVMFVSLEDLKEITGGPRSDLVDARALCTLVVLDEFMEDEGDAIEQALTRAIARQR
jgi:hypothetical protein